MGKYKKKPVVVEAVQFVDTSDSIHAICEMNGGDISVDYSQKPPVLKVYTFEGVMTANVGDYIIRGVKGEIYPCKPDIFEQTYERVE